MGDEGKRKKCGDENNAEHGANDQQSTKKRKRKEVAIYGNYRNYYGYRVGQEMEEDPRLKVMKKEWFEGRDCLDIGCNSGAITIAIAKKFACNSIHGIDIDGGRVEEANWNLRRIVKTSTQNVSSKTSKLEDKNQSKSTEQSVNKMPTEETVNTSKICPFLQLKDLSDVVEFQKGNFVQHWRAPEGRTYHTILCLSVSKWIHLNWGDDGLITLFSRIWKLLQPGGIFIFEPQPWTSYYKNRLVSEVARTNYHDIEIYPESFQDILLDKIGFRKVENITSSLSGSKSGFNRPILAFWK